MIWSDEINAVAPPYAVRIVNTMLAPPEVRLRVQQARDWLAQSRREFRETEGRDVDVCLELA